MTISRRDFVKAGVTAAAFAAVPRPLLVRLGRTPEPVPPIDDPRLEALVARALDAARAAGAAYADVRLTHDRTRTIDATGAVLDAEALDVGVRALVRGYWGFAAGPVWSADEMVRLGNEAVAQATTNALGKPRIAELASAPVVGRGHWVMPVAIDPFDVPPNEIVDLLAGLSLHATRIPGVSPGKNFCQLFTQEKAFGSTAGTYCTQRTYRTTGVFELGVERGDRRGAGRLQGLGPEGAGWELYRAQPLYEAIRRLVEEIEEDMALPVKPVDVGRYPTVLDARSVARLVAQTIGRATELDRAMGYEANAGGTSYLNDPLAMLGHHRVGAPGLTITANRSEPGGCATVAWDDDGVAPDEITLVKNGILMDYQTTRESATWLAPYYAAHGAPVRSHGCAAAPSAVFAPLQHAPNLVMAPGARALDFDGLVAELGRGVAIKGAELGMDFQCLNGFAQGRAYEVKGGKRVARIAPAGVLLRAPELWKALRTIGGPASAHRFGMSATKGEPEQETFASVTAPPALFESLTIIDPTRKA
ncbi:MAG: TldD/PmbA family protein [Gemmatimonadaceae bacterium]|nr:TldD/PmbA family protein [Gemmatimonadaceae bacterium]